MPYEIVAMDIPLNVTLVETKATRLKTAAGTARYLAKTRVPNFQKITMK